MVFLSASIDECFCIPSLLLLSSRISFRELKTSCAAGSTAEEDNEREEGDRRQTSPGHYSESRAQSASEHEMKTFAVLIGDNNVFPRVCGL